MNNHFTKTSEKGAYTIADGVISPVSGTYYPGQYVRLKGSILNDGVYKVVSLDDGEITLEGLPQGANEMFTGYVYGLAVPGHILSLADEVTAFQAEASKERPDVISETFRNYSYTKATNAKGGAITWIQQFMDRLVDDYRMIDSPEAEIRKNNR